MNAPENDRLKGLALLRAEFPLKLISRLPKGTKAQNECPNEQKVNCKVCGGWHHPKVQHIDYVGHAALTDRLLDADPEWNWEPVAVGPDGSPVLDKDGGMWIKLTVCGVTRLGYGDAQGKTGPNAVKERIGDALRNAAMRFGAALDLWSKVDIHFDEREDEVKATIDRETGEITYPQADFDKNLPTWQGMIREGKTTADRLIAKISTKAPLTDAQKAAISQTTQESV